MNIELLIYHHLIDAMYMFRDTINMMAAICLCTTFSERLECTIQYNNHVFVDTFYSYLESIQFHAMFRMSQVLENCNLKSTISLLEIRLSTIELHRYLDYKRNTLS